MQEVTNETIQKHFGFTLEELKSGKVKYDLDQWFRDLDQAIDLMLKQDSFSDSSTEEKARFKCLGYMACCTFATETDPRDLSEKTFPHFQQAILELQENLHPFGILLEALQKRNIDIKMAGGASRQEAVKKGSRLMQEAYERSFVPGAAEVAQMEIEW